MTPPAQAPRNEPTWWLKKATPVSVARNLTPKISVTSPFTSGMTPSQRSPIAAAKRSVESWLGGRTK